MSKVTVFRIEGVATPGCTEAIEGAVSALPGVSLAKVSMMAQTATVEHTEACSDSQIRLAIRRCGYETDEGRSASLEQVIDTKVAIRGMTCGACSAAITEAVQKIDGVESAAVSLVTETGLFKHSSAVLAELVVAAIEECGFEASVLLSAPAGSGTQHTVTSRFSVAGMTCAACSGSITLALEATMGVHAAVVSLITNEAVVTHDVYVDTALLAATIGDCGFDAVLVESAATAEAEDVEEVVLQVHGMDSSTDINGFRYNLEAFLQSKPGIIGHTLVLANSGSAQEDETENSAPIQALVSPDTEHFTADSIFVDEVSITYMPLQVGIRDLVDGMNRSFGGLMFSVVNSVDQACATQLKMLSREKEIAYWKTNFVRSLVAGLPVMLLHYLQHYPPLRHATIFPGLYWASLVQLVLSTYVQFVLGHTFNRKLYKCLLRKSASSMDVLVSISTLISYGFSVLVLFLSVWSGQTSQPPRVLFDTNVMLICFISLGKCLENRAKGATSTALLNLLELLPTTCVIVADPTEYHLSREARSEKQTEEKNDKVGGQKQASNDPVAELATREIGIDLVQPNDIAIALPGSKIPADGVIVYGSSDVDESIITGESIPVFKQVGDSVIGGSINGPSVIHIRVVRTGKKSQLQQIINLVRDSQTSRAPVQRLADRLALRFVPGVLALASATLVFWLVACSRRDALLPPVFSADENGKYFVCLKLAISVIVVACPCALGLAAPTAVMVGTGVGAAHGALIKGGEVLENANRIGIVLLDKTGTLTTGNMAVVGVEYCGDMAETAWYQLVGTVEGSSEHPLGRAVLRYARAQAGLRFEEDCFRTGMANFASLTGKGVSADVQLDGTTYAVVIGNRQLMRERFNMEVPNPDDHSSRAYVVVDGAYTGSFSLMDQLRPSARDVVSYLRYTLGLQVGIVSGDTQASAQHVARQLGLPAGNVFAEVLATNKDRVVAQMKERFQCGVAFVGDGINDAPALARADIGMAVSSGTDVAIDSADMVLVATATHHGIDIIPTALSISRATLRRIKANFALSVVYNALMVPFAMGCFLPFNLMLPPVAAGAAMAMSSVSVVVASLLLKRWKPPVVAGAVEPEDQLYGFTLRDSTAADLKQLQRLGRTGARRRKLWRGGDYEMVAAGQ